MSLDTQEMEGVPPIEQAQRAIVYALRRIRDCGEVGWYCGVGTQMFALLAGAYATLTGATIKDVRERFMCGCPVDPREEGRQAAIAEAMAGEVRSAEDPADKWEPSPRDILAAFVDLSMVERQELIEDIHRQYCGRCGCRTIIRPCSCVPAKRRAMA